MSDMVAGTWTNRQPACNLGSVRDALKDMMTRLRAWSKENFGHVMRDIEKLRKELAEL